MYLIDLITRFFPIQEVSPVNNKVIPAILHKKRGRLNWRVSVCNNETPSFILTSIQMLSKEKDVHISLVATSKSPYWRLWEVQDHGPAKN